MCQDNVAAKKAQQALKAERAVIEAEKAELAKEKAEAEEREKELTTEVEKCHSFMLRISEDCHPQGLWQVAFYHDVSVEDPHYDLDKDVVDVKLVPIGGNVDTATEEANDGENDVNP